MDTNEYLTSARDLYIQAMTSGETPEMLRDLGGPLSLAGADVEEARTEKNGFLGFIDKQRSIASGSCPSWPSWATRSPRRRPASTTSRRGSFIAAGRAHRKRKRSRSRR